MDKALAAITEWVKTGKGNLLELAVEAARVRATLGEISYACEQVLSLIHIYSVSMINEDRSLEPVKSTTRDTGLNCEANVSYQPCLLYTSRCV